MDETTFKVAKCLLLVKNGDEHAARSLVDHLYPTVIRIVRRNLPRKAAEEELAQDIFVKMFANMESYRGEVPFEHWVSRIATNHCLNAIRAQKSRPEWRMADLSDEHEAAIGRTAEDMSRTHPATAIAAREFVETLLECLTPEDRLIINLQEMEGYSTEEIKAVTGWSVPYIRVRAFRARRKLNKRYEALKARGKI
jgi:RNA polymerase sigma-70 factor (ECF subfamily)